MAPGHARLGPSSAERWGTCPGSVELSAQVVDLGGEAANEGTACHRMLEAFLKEGTPVASWRGKKVQIVEEVESGPQRVAEVLVTDEMVGWVEEAVEWVVGYLHKMETFLGHKPHIMSEERVFVGKYFGCPDDLWGTADVLIEAEVELVIADLKAGYVDVQVKDNQQLLLYAIGAMQEYGWAHEQVRLVILQPRAGGVKEEVYSRQQILDAARRFVPKVRAALQPGGRLVPSEKGCKWCPAAGICPAAQAENLALAQREFSDERVRTLDREALLTLLNHADRIRSTLLAAERHALSLVQAGIFLPGWKVAAGEKRATWAAGKEGAAQVVLETEFGLDLDEVAPRKLSTPPQVSERLAAKMEGKTKKERLEKARALVYTWVEKPKGEPTLVRDEDPRPALKPGAEFEEVV